MKAKKILTLLSTVFVLTACGTTPTSSFVDSDSVEPHEAYDTGYYKDIYRDSAGPRLRSALHKLVYSTHTTYITYGSMSSYGLQTDMDTEVPTKCTNFYTSKRASYGTREHVWPCANSAGLWARGDAKDPDADDIDKASYKGGGADLFHVRPCDFDVNEARSNSKFTVFAEGDSYEVIGDGGQYQLKYTSDHYRSEPADAWKGDIARILVYVFIHYGIGSDKYCGNLKLDNVMYRPNDEPIEFVYERLVQWNEIDPPSEQEKLRNENVMGIQGNRNPFIDYPELMRKCFNL